MMAKGWVEAVAGWLFGVAELSVVGCLGGWWKWVVEQIWEGDSNGWGGGYGRDLCNLFRIIKWKHMFMETDMTGNINTVRCNVKTLITKM